MNFTQLQHFQFFDKYSRFDWELGRRETWPETVRRAVDFLRELSGGVLDKAVYDEMEQAILAMEVLPSMRLLSQAGESARRNNLAIYNCSFLPIDGIDSFVEMLTLLMAGVGVGYSVESFNVNKLPAVRNGGSGRTHEIVVEDSSAGWALAFRKVLFSAWNGIAVKVDYSLVRPAGQPLMTKGGTASGPEPLRKLLDFAYEKIRSRAGQKIRTIDAHDIACMVANCIVSGGVRRSALICLFDREDEALLNCKSPENIKGNEHRWFANNSAVWDSPMTLQEVREQMELMHANGMGEPGIFSRRAAMITKPERRELTEGFGTNPCGEITLNARQLCNLSAAVARAGDLLPDLERKVRLATIIGTIQSMATGFVGVGPDWAKNCERERLLGVDITGQMDCPEVRRPSVLTKLRTLAVETNKEFASKLGINQSASVTCVKPSGNSSVLVDCSSGLHARFAPYYIRRVRMNANSPIAKLFVSEGYPLRPENGQKIGTATTLVAEFPVKSPEGSTGGTSALAQLSRWANNKLYWTEHNPSCTITYEPDELEEISAWLFANQHIVGGLSFLPKQDAHYEQMPYEEIDEQRYNEMVGSLPTVDFERLSAFEHSDLTEGAQLLACVAGNCDI